MLRSIEAIRQTMGTFESSECRMLLDGEDISGAYLLVEALNTPAFGPRIKVAPEADPSDGLLEVLRIRDDVRQRLSISRGRGSAPCRYKAPG